MHPEYHVKSNDAETSQNAELINVGDALLSLQSNPGNSMTYIFTSVALRNLKELQVQEMERHFM